MGGMLRKNIIFEKTPSVDAWFQLISKQLLQVSPPYLVRGWTNPFEKYATVKVDHHFPNFPGEK